MYILVETHVVGEESYTDILGIYMHKETAYEAAIARAREQEKTMPSKLPDDQFIWTFNDRFSVDDILNYTGVAYMCIGDTKTDSIVEYFDISLQEGELKG